MTLRPLGPRVTLTARASLAMPRRIASRASWSNAICFAAILPPNVMSKGWSGFASDLLFRGHSRARNDKSNARLLFQHREHVLLAHEEDFVGPAAVLEL